MYIEQQQTKSEAKEKGCLMKIIIFTSLNNQSNEEIIFSYIRATYITNNIHSSHLIWNQGDHPNWLLINVILMSYMGRASWTWKTLNKALYKEQYAIMESLTYYGYGGIDNGNKVCHFLQGIKSRFQQKIWWRFQCSRVLSGLNDQERLYNATHPYFQNLELASEAKSGGLHKKIECRKYAKSSRIPWQKSSRCRWENCMSNEVSSLQPATRAKARNAALEAQLRISS